MGPAVSVCPSGTFPAPSIPHCPNARLIFQTPQVNRQPGQEICLLQQLSAAGGTPNDTGAQYCSSPTLSPCSSSSERREGNSLQGRRLAGLLAEAAMAKLTGSSLSQLRSLRNPPEPVSFYIPPYPASTPHSYQAAPTHRSSGGAGAVYLILVCPVQVIALRVHTQNNRGGDSRFLQREETSGQASLGPRHRPRVHYFPRRWPFADSSPFLQS